ncbi:hypothetical protein [Roseicella sp. DB1501]|nr:hypothetical protein [Roseicella sp. DB1501]
MVRKAAHPWRRRSRTTPVTDLLAALPWIFGLVAAAAAVQAAK